MTTAGASATQTGTGEGGQTGTAGATATQAIEYKFDALEGATPEFDDDIKSTAKELGWTQEQAAKFRAYEFKLAQADIAKHKTASEQAAAQAKLAKEQADTQRRTDWEKANRDHKDFGGAKYAETSERVKQLVDRFDADKSFAKELEQAPELLNHPAFRGFLARIAYSMAEGTFHQGAPAATTPPADKTLFYGKTG